MNEIKIESRIELKDYVEFFMMNRGQWSYACSLGLFGVGLFCLSQSFFAFAKSACIVLFIEIYYAYQIRKMFRSDSEIRYGCVYSFSDEGIIDRNNDGVTVKEVKWKDLYKVIVGRNCIFLYISSFKALVLPKRYVSEEQYIALNEFVKAKRDPKGIETFKPVRFSLIVLGKAIIVFIAMVLLAHYS